MEFIHKSIMVSECMDALKPERGGVFVDCTAGGGGHSIEIAKRLPAGSRLICLDRDEDAIAACTERLRRFSNISTIIKAPFSEIGQALDSVGIEKIDGVMWDLGVSSYQLDEAERGFSYMEDAPLDMRMDRDSPITAADVVNTYGEDELKQIFFEYGEEKFASRIASAILKRRAVSAIKTTGELADIIAGAIPVSARRRENQHPAKRTFQAIRIEVNRELDEIQPSLEEAVKRLRRGGAAAVITFHSLEDRIVKQTFASMTKGCVCPPEFPVCVCGHTPVAELLSKRPVVPSAEEIAGNPRARSAKLRAVRRL